MFDPANDFVENSVEKVELNVLPVASTFELEDGFIGDQDRGGGEVLLAHEESNTKTSPGINRQDPVEPGARRATTYSPPQV